MIHFSRRKYIYTEKKIDTSISGPGAAFVFFLEKDRMGFIDGESGYNDKGSCLESTVMQMQTV